MISEDDRLFFNALRGGSIFRVVLAHLGLSWFYQPYSGYVLVFLPLLFFVSGAVSYGSFIRQKKISNYIINRYLTIALPYYLFLLLSFVCLWLFESRFPALDYSIFFQYITFNAANLSDTWPIPLAHVWFLHSLFFILILSLFIFILGKINPMFLLLGVFISLSLGIGQSFFDLGKFFWVFNYNLYQPLSNLGFFTLGAFFFHYREKFCRKINISIFLMLLIATITFSFFYVDNYNIDDHFYYPNLFYMLCCYSAIFFVLSLKNEIITLLKNFIFMKKFLLFINQNAYAVYLLHVYIIYVLATKFGLMDLSGEPSRMVLKIVLAIITTIIFAVPFSYATKNILFYLRKKLLVT